MLLIAALIGQAQNITVHGTVVSAADDDPLIGASVVCGIEGPGGVATDIDGNFEITVPEGANLIVSYIGYQTKTVAAEPRMTIALEEDSELLNEVVVTGYSTQRKVDVTGAITAVDVNEIAKQNENNPIKALQGRVPGMNISADGGPSGSATVRIRGIGTLNNNDPLYIIDGVPTKGGMHELNPNDIETIQILKDAASASIYGSRAANGVIIITTKKGNDLKINLDASVAAQFYTHRMKVLNADGYGRAMWQAYVNGGEDPNTNGLGYRYNWGYDADGYPVLHSMTMNRYLDSKGITPAADTDWFDETTRTGLVQNYNLSVSGSTEKLSSFFSLGYYKNVGVIKYTDFERFSARINTEYKPLGNVLTIGEHFTLNRTDEVQSPGGFLQNVLQANPSLPVYTTTGEFAGPVGGYPDRENPYARLIRNKDNRYVYWRMFGDAYVNLNLFKGFNVRTTFGLDYSQKQQRFFTYPITEGNVANSTNAVEAKQEHWTRWMWNLVANYNIDFGKNHLDALVGMELNRETANWFSGYKMNFSVLNPDFMWPDAGVGKAQAYGSGDGFSLVSFFGKANYSFDNRYLAGVTLRYDGSSRFGANNRYATFPSVSLGWRMNNEKFLRGATWLNDLKLRLSWGQTGNQEISNLARYFVYVPNYGVNESGGQSYGTSYDIAGTNGGSILQSGFKRNQIGNPDIRWETTTQYNVGLDWSMFATRFFGSIDFYYKKTSDILVEMIGIAAMGEGSSQWINAGEMNNRGVELNLGWRHDTHYGFHYEITGNISAYRNKITALPATVAANGTFGGNGVFSVVDHTYGAQAGYVADGIFRNQAEVDNHAVQEGAAPGRIRWRDLDGNGYIDERDQQWIYDPTPAFTYGINVYLQYRDFDFSMFWQGAQGQDVISDLKKETDLWSGLNIGFLNKGERLLSAWTPQNPNSEIPALSRSDINNEKRVSTFYVEDGSYLKLRNIQFGYKLPAKITDKMHLQRLRFYVSAQNLLTIKSSNFTGVDPENPNYGYPIATNVTFGLNATF
ncbi:MAG: TonB-dependent receptor [Muribaculaceae bacterium]|nr:TonB-dependent receptor [Muribaculaceae bacterium]